MSTCDYELTRRYLRQRYQQARAERLAASASIGEAAEAAELKRPGLLDRLALRVGELLVAFGLRLKNRYWAAAGRPHHFFILDLGAD